MNTEIIGIQSLGDKMKALEQANKKFVDSQGLIMMRLDGKGFSKYTKGFERPFDHEFMEDMNETAKFLCKEIQGAIVAYVQSDEITIFIWNKDKDGAQTWFEGNVSKMESLSASMAAAKFNQLRMARATSDYGGDLRVPMLSKENIMSFKLATFDSRVWQVNSFEEVLETFIWRQRDFKINSVSAVAQCHFSHNELESKGTTERLQMLQSKGVLWENCLPEEKYGRLISKIKVESQLKDGTVFERSTWIAEPAYIIHLEQEKFSETFLKIFEKI